MPDEQSLTDKEIFLCKLTDAVIAIYLVRIKPQDYWTYWH
jgi:hypothetical protein